MCKLFVHSSSLRVFVYLLSRPLSKGYILFSSFMYSAAIWTAERCGDAKTAIFLLASMRSNRCTPNAVSYDGGKKQQLYNMI